MTLGSVSAGGDGGGASVQKNHPTVGQISGGALVEKLIPANIIRDHHLELLLREPDFTSAARMAAAINVRFTNSAEAIDATSVRVRVPEELESAPVDFVSELELIEMEPDVPARIVINERTGTIVATSRIRISSCAVAHGNLTISISTSSDVSQPNAFSSGGQTVVTPKTDAKVKEDKGTFVALPDLPTVEKVAAALNSLGVTPRDVMSMFQAMKEAGALQADLLIR
jgi:flagellar P-ring protein precursor FlgI